MLGTPVNKVTTVNQVNSPDTAMPVDYKNYPLDWRTRIRPAILKRAEYCCEECGLPNYCLINRETEHTITHHCNRATTRYGDASWLKRIANLEDYIIIVLTIAHKDHNPMNSNPENLLALCQACHNRMDVRHRIATRQRNRRKHLAKTAPELPLVTDIITNLTA